MAFVPDDGPPRLIRFVEVMPLPNILSIFFKASNLLLIDRELWERLSDMDRHIVMRTEAPCLEINYPPNHPPVVTRTSN